jgi:hypothetical protein
VTLSHAAPTPARLLGRKSKSKRAKRVLIVGAGASVSAGYPSAERLFETLGQDAQMSRNSQLINAWKQWEESIRDAPPAIQHLLTASNPEIALSLLDLCEEYSRENFAMIFAGDKGRLAANQSLDSEKLDPGLFADSGQAWIDNAVRVRNQLILLLGEYFLWRHGEDAEHPERRFYLRDFLDRLRPGDVVITLNWDSTIERTLLELGRWSPVDGYGFTRHLRADGVQPQKRLPSILAAKSDVRVLKLHGSVGWRSGNNHELMFDNLWLQFLLPASLVETIVDADARLFADTLPHALAYPSYLKRFENRFILEIWHRADQALRRADEVEIWGYSLPASDSAVGVLLQSLRARAREEKIRPEVYNPNPEHRDRFRQFFDGHVSLHDARLGQ